MKYDRDRFLLMLILLSIASIIIITVTFTSISIESTGSDNQSPPLPVCGWTGDLPNLETREITLYYANSIAEYRQSDEADLLSLRVLFMGSIDYPNASYHLPLRLAYVRPITYESGLDKNGLYLYYDCAHITAYRTSQSTWKLDVNLDFLGVENTHVECETDQIRSQPNGSVINELAIPCVGESGIAVLNLIRFEPQWINNTSP